MLPGIIVTMADEVIKTVINYRDSAPSIDAIIFLSQKLFCLIALHSNGTLTLSEISKSAMMYN